MPDAPAPDDALLRRFLLGESTPAERERIERYLFEDPDGLERIEAAEDELLDACARGELAEPERARVLERLAATPAGRRRLAFAKDLARLADGLSETQPGFIPTAPAPPRRRTLPPRWAAAALAAGLAAVVVAGSWARWCDGQSTGQQANLPGSTPGTAVPARPSETIVWPLALSTERGGGTTVPRQSIPPGTRTVELHVQLEDGESYPSYRAEVLVAGRPVASKAGLVPRPVQGGAEIVLAVPAERLPPGNYEVAVYGERGGAEMEEVGFQELPVVR